MSEGTDRIDALIARVREDRAKIAAAIVVKLGEVDKMRRAYAGTADRIDALLTDRLDAERADAAAQMQADAAALQAGADVPDQCTCYAHPEQWKQTCPVHSIR